MNKISIAIDGPAGAGKSTIAKIIAEKLNINYVDTGAMYRAFTYKVLSRKIEFNNIKEITRLLKETNIDFKDNHIYLDNQIVDEEIRENKISKNVSDIAKIKEVRERLVEIQREIANNKSIIMDGRDIGTHVLPNAEYKFFLIASVNERGRRRYLELKKYNKEVSLDKLIKEIEERDRIDSTREVSPLRKSRDAIEIDTTNLSIEDVVDTIISYIKN